MDDIDLIIATVSDTSEDILQCNEEKQETMYEIIEVELRGVQEPLYSIHVVSTTALPLEETELGDELTQIHRIDDTTKAHICRV
jgi:hypothetical protein